METDSNEFRMNPSDALRALDAQGPRKMTDDAVIPSTGSITMKSAVGPGKSIHELRGNGILGSPL
jgi:hypothetical protein